MHVKFLCTQDVEGVFPEPKPAIRMAPSFYKKLQPKFGPAPNNNTVKRCVPFLDALSQGFIIPLWADLYVKARDGEIETEMGSTKETLHWHDNVQIKGHPLEGTPYTQNALKFRNPWVVETEENVSCLFTAPFNHLETRFKILDGVVDTDTYYNHINFPFIWTAGEGDFLIKQGTPLVQVIPFYRQEKLTHSVEVVDQKKLDISYNRMGARITNGYREQFWHKRKQQDNE